MAKGGTQVDMATLPKFAETKIQQGLNMGADVAGTGYVPYYGPDVAALSPREEAAFKSTDMAASAFGMPTAGAGSYLPETTTMGGVTGYSSAPMYEASVDALKANRPAQADYLESFTIDPVTGEQGSRMVQNQPFALEMQGQGRRGGKQMGGSANPNMVQPQGGQYGFGGGVNNFGGGGYNQVGADGFGVSNNQATPQNPYEMAAGAQTDAMGMARGGADMVSGAQNYLGAGANLVGSGADMISGAQNYLGAGANLVGSGTNMIGSGADMISAGSDVIGEGKDIVTGALGSLNPAQQRAQQGMTQTAAEGMATYQNPYEDQVVQQSMRDIGNRGLELQNQLAAQAGAAGAFGGSRHGIAEAELAKGTQQQMLDQAAKLRAQGFNTALGASQADMASQLGAAGQSAGMAGQAAGMGGQISGMGSAMGGLGSQMVGAGGQMVGAGGQMGSFGSAMGGLGSAMGGLGGQMGGFGSALGGLGSTMSGIGSNLSNMGQTSFNMGNTIADRQAAAGGVERGIMDQLIGAGKGQYGQYTQQPTTALNTLLGTITGTGAPTYQGSSSSFNPGLFNIFQTLAMMPKG